jgi:hypothetical protein
VPGVTDFATVSQGAFTLTFDPAGGANVGSMSVDSAMTFSHTANSTLSTNQLLIANASGAASYNLSAGTLSTTTLTIGTSLVSTGTLNVTGSTLNVTNFNLGISGTANYTQSGAAILNLTGNANIGGSAVAANFRVNGGGVFGGTLNVGASGILSSTGAGSISNSTIVNLNGGQATGTLDIEGTLNANSGTISALLTTVGTTNANGANFTGTVSNFGAFNVNQNTSVGTIVLNSGSSFTLDFNRQATITSVSTLGGFVNDGIATINSGTLSMPSGTWHVGSAGFGQTIQSGGVANVRSLKLGVGSLATGYYYLFSTATLNATTITLGANGDGTLQLSGGTLNSTGAMYIGSGATGSGVVSMFSGNLNLNSSQLAVGYSGAGTFLQTGGAVTSTNSSVIIGSTPTGIGFYKLSGGALSISNANLMVGVSSGSQGRLIQTGGLVSAQLVVVGSDFANGGTGQYDISGGTLQMSNHLNLGTESVGTFNQSGGVVSAVATAFIATGNGTGTYNLSGGTVSMPGIQLGVGGTLNQTGGYLAVGTINNASNPHGWTFSAGVASLTSSVTIGDLLPSDFSTTPARSFYTSGGTTLPQFSALTLNGGTYSTGSLTSSGGQVAFNSGTLIVNSAQTIDVNTPLGASPNIPTGANLSLTGNLTVSSAGLLYLGGRASATGGITNNGQITLASPLAELKGGAFNNNKLLTGTGRIANDFTNNAAGEVRVNANDGLHFTSLNAATNLGKITLAGGSIEMDAGMVNAGTMSGRGSFYGGTGWNNSGTVNTSAGFSDFHGALINNGRFNVTGGSTTTFYSPVQSTAGTINVNQNSTVVFLANLFGLSHVTGPGIKDFESTASGGPVASVVGSSIVGLDGTVNADYFNEQNVDVWGDVHITSNGTNAAVSTIRSLTIQPGGKFDLADNALIIDYSNGTPLNTIRGYLLEGFNSGSWNGNGLTSISAQLAAATSTRMSLALAEATDLYDSFPAIFRGQSVDSSSLLIDYTLEGDANFDHKVNTLDFNLLSGNFGLASGDRWSRGDFNYDAAVNSLDFNALLANYGKTQPVSAPMLGAVVPEPASIALLAFVTAGVRRRRR